MAEVEDLSTLRTFRFIRDFIAQNGFSPSHREIARGTYVAATTMITYLTRLEVYGWIVREYNIPRSIRIGEYAPDDSTFERLWQQAIQAEEDKAS